MAFTAEKRQKEIGIRKVVGATVAGLVTLLSADLLKLSLLAMVVAFPLSWWGLHHWLENFAYRVSIGPVLFLVTGGVTLFITLSTISFQAIRAARANPVKSLRSE
jgi:ABC-type antimicrobial peptide transport system permease subunit